MGTRHLICVVKDGQFRVAQYGQWDGYPSGQGQDIVKFLRKDYNPTVFAQQIDRIKHLSEEEVEAQPATAEHLNRDCGAGILPYIQNAESPEVFLSLEFAADSLFCEWLYLLDLDRQELQVFEGFNQKPLDPKERFAFLKPLKPNHKSQPQYHPVRHLKTFKISELTAATMPELQKEVESRE